MIIESVMKSIQLKSKLQLKSTKISATGADPSSKLLNKSMDLFELTYVIAVKKPIAPVFQYEYGTSLSSVTKEKAPLALSHFLIH